MVWTQRTLISFFFHHDHGHDNKKFHVLKKDKKNWSLDVIFINSWKKKETKVRKKTSLTWWVI
jgi:hypothetical protein